MTRKKSSKKEESEVLANTDSENPLNFKLNEIKFKTERQFDLYKKMANDDVKLLFISGVAGTAKTYLSVFTALKLLKQESVDQVIYVRKAVESSDEPLGFLPGLLEDKYAAYTIPLEEKLSLFLDIITIKKLKNKDLVKAVPINFLRGVDWQNKCIIIDEGQNISMSEFKTILTRIGEGCKVFCIGDKMQSDIGNRSAFAQMLEVFEDEAYKHKDHGIYVEYLTEDDIVRSGLCKHITLTFSRLDKILRK